MFTRFYVILTTAVLASLSGFAYAEFTQQAKAGLTIHVFDTDEQALEGVDVLLIIGKDTVSLKSGKDGEVFYRGPFRRPIFKLLLSHSGYISREVELKAPTSPLSEADTRVYLHRKKEDTQ